MRDFLRRCFYKVWFLFRDSSGNYEEEEEEEEEEEVREEVMKSEGKMWKARNVRCMRERERERERERKRESR